MLKKFVVAALTTALVAVNAPIAHAAVIGYQCNVTAFANDLLTGSSDTYGGSADGLATFDDGDTHTLRCIVRVDGSDVASTPLASGSGFVYTVGLVTFQLVPGSWAEICTEIDDVTLSCTPASINRIPPPQVVDVLDLVLTVLADVIAGVKDSIPGSLTNFIDNVTDIINATICPLLIAAAPGIPGVIDIVPGEGDTTVAVVGPFWDCPPYGNLGSASLPLPPIPYILVLTGTDPS